MADEAEQKLVEWKTLVEGGNAAYAKRRLSEAELKFAAALRIAEKEASNEQLEKLEQSQKDETNSRLAKSLNNMAALYHSQGKYSMAEDLYKRCLEINQKLHGDEHFEVALNWHNLAALYSARNRFDEAEDLYKRSLALRERLLGNEHPDLITLLNNYALLLKRVDRPDEAAAMEDRVKRISAQSAKI